MGKIAERIMGRFYNTQQWQDIRRIQLNKEPLCRECRQYGRTRAANEVDHITPIAEGGSATDPENLQSLCKTHHSQKTRRENTQERGIVTVLAFSDEVIVKGGNKKRKPWKRK